jgi:hypothetical protein
MTLGHPFHLRLDWWTTEEAQAQKLKLWTAGQRVTDLLLGHHKQKKKKRKGRPDELIQVYTPSTREHFANVVAKYPGVPVFPGEAQRWHNREVYRPEAGVFARRHR